MKSKAIIPLVVGLGIGVVAIKLFVDVLKRAKGDSAPVATKPVVVARTDITSTIEISDQMIDVVDVPVQLVPHDTFGTPEEVIGRVSSHPIPRGVPVVNSLLAPPGTPPGLASRIKEGYRAMAVKIDEVAGVGGWLKPGSRVDVVVVLSSRTRSAGGNASISRVILQNVEVLTVGQEIEGSERGASLSRSVTLMVSPEQATRLHLAAARGRLQLAMRNPEDSSEPRVLSATDNDLLTEGVLGGLGAPEGAGSLLLSRLFSREPKVEPEATDKAPEVVQVAAAVPASKEWTVEVIQGSKVERVRFDGDDRQARRLVGPEGRSSQAQPRSRAATNYVPPPTVAPPVTAPPAEPPAEFDVEDAFLEADDFGDLLEE